MRTVGRLAGIFCAVFFLGGAQAATPRAAEAYPQRPVRLIVPYPPGGTADVMARVMAQKLGDYWRATLVVEYVYQDQNERQRMALTLMGGVWLIESAESSQRVQPLIPYGKPVSDVQ